jgi:hypothetical protein
MTEQPDPCPEHESNQLTCVVCSNIRRAFYESVVGEDHPGVCFCPQCEVNSLENDSDWEE